jgi:hypothetical protein
MAYNIIYVREVSQTAGAAGAAGTYFRLVRLFRLLRLAGIRFRSNMLAINDTVKHVQKTIHLFHDVVSNSLFHRYLALQASQNNRNQEYFRWKKKSDIF